MNQGEQELRSTSRHFLRLFPNLRPPQPTTAQAVLAGDYGRAFPLVTKGEGLSRWLGPLLCYLLFLNDLPFVDQRGFISEAYLQSDPVHSLADGLDLGFYDAPA
jgi:hypothetical protein